MRKLIWIIFIIIISNLAHAQANIEGVRKDLVNKEGVSGKGSISLSASDGNKSEITYGASTLIGARVDFNLIFTNLWTRIGYRNGQLHENVLFGHLRYNLKLEDYLLKEVFVQTEKDNYRDLELRYIFGFGPRFVFDILDWFSIVYGTSYMYEVNKVENNPEIYIFHRWNNYKTIQLNLDNLIIDNTIYYQPVFNNFSNYRFFNASSIGIAKDNVGAKITFQYQYESIPPAKKIKSKDIKILTSLSIKF